MIIKMSREEKVNGVVESLVTEVFEGVSNYRFVQTFGDEKHLYLFFDYKGELLDFDLMDYQQVYIMNDNGKTIDKIRNLNFDYQTQENVVITVGGEKVL